MFEKRWIYSFEYLCFLLAIGVFESLERVVKTWKCMHSLFHNAVQQKTSLKYSLFINIFIILCYALVCDLYGMFWDLNAMLRWEVDKKTKWYGMLWLLCNAMRCEQSASTFTEELQTFRSKIIKKKHFTQTQCKYIFIFFKEIKKKIKLKLYCNYAMICYGMLWRMRI